MDEYLKNNRELWDELTPIHEQAEEYGVREFKAGECSLRPTEKKEVGDVSGKSLLHLQCHFGMDTLSWARLGAAVTGMDFSEKAIDLARSLSRETGIKADFICCDVYDLPSMLTGEFDIVFTSYGVLAWLPDLNRWAEIIARYLRPGGFFYIVEGHPVLQIFENSEEARDFEVRYSYFHRQEPTEWEPEGDYADRSATVQNSSYEWTHNMGEIINALIGAGLRIEFLHEFPVSGYRWSSFTEKTANGEWHIEGDKIPLTFSIKAVKD
ncbi:class I SAM-dependent methyltransferase [Chloroflexota bacterium]